MDKKNIIILGTGFAGFSCLKKLNKKNYNITVISPRNHFLFTPLLPSTTVGTIEFRSIIEPIRNTKEIKFFKANCLNIDAINNIITCEDSRSGEKFNVPFHILILAVGEMSNSYNIVGVKENSYFLRELSDARRIRTRVIECFEKASFPNLTTEQKKNYLRFFVCGGGPTGVEFAAELHDFIEEDVKRKYKELADLTELILIEAESKLLNSFDSKLSEYTMRLFRRHHIIVKTGLSIIKVTKDLLYVNDGTKYNYGILVWTAGNTATNLIKDCDFEKSKRNKIIVDKYFKVIGHDNTYAIGDCCEPEGEMYPVTGQVAQQEGRYLGKALNRLSKQKVIKPFRFHDLGMLAYVGSSRALADTPQYKGSGFATFIFWRSVYLTKLVSLKNKILVLFDWFKNLIFGRDVSSF